MRLCDVEGLICAHCTVCPCVMMRNLSCHLHGDQQVHQHDQHQHSIDCCHKDGQAAGNGVDRQNCLECAELHVPKHDGEQLKHRILHAATDAAAHAQSSMAQRSYAACSAQHAGKLPDTSVSRVFDRPNL